MISPDMINTQALIEERQNSLIAQASKTLNQNQECYVAQWILHNQDKNFNDYELSFRWRQDGFGYNVFMVKKGEIE